MAVDFRADKSKTENRDSIADKISLLLTDGNYRLSVAVFPFPTTLLQSLLTTPSLLALLSAHVGLSHSTHLPLFAKTHYAPFLLP